MLGPQRGMGPVWLQAGQLKKCDELHTEPCDIVATDQCCAVVPCSLCLVWEVYGTDTVYGRATFEIDSGRWTGQIAGADFAAYWQRSYETNACEFIVEIDNVIVAVKTCADLSCRDPAGSQGMVIEYDSGLLSWYVYEKHPLPYVTTDDGCKDFFCGLCECTCKTLCVTVRARSGSSAFFLEGSNNIELSGYTNCDAPEWTGVVNTTLGPLSEAVNVYVYLYRHPDTGKCWSSGTVRGQELTPREVSCDMSATYTLYDGSVVVIKCRDCSCDSTVCAYCCLPLDFTNPDYPAGVLKSIPYSLAGCDNDGPGTFVTSGTAPCTERAAYLGETWSTPPQLMYTGGTAPNGSCANTPCTNTFGLVLECSDRFVQPGDNSGCDRLWLWIGSTRLLVGDIGEQPLAGLPGLSSWIRVRPTSCACDAVGGVSAIFAFSITIDCSGAAQGDPYGPCAGLTIDCCEYSCSGTLMI